MTTSEFIKLLQEADPSGKAHIRMPDGIPICVMLKEGYYDGAYAYYENGNYIMSTKGMKVDVYCRSLEDFIDDMVFDNNSNNPITWDEVKEKVKYDLILQGNAQSRIDELYKTAKKYYDESIQYLKEFNEKNK